MFLARGSGEVAFVAGRRIGGAVERNRARRVLRAAWRELANWDESTHDCVVVAREAIRGARTQDLEAEMIDLIHRGDARR